ncbi:MAG: L-serine ammonia-lyase, iron-sulfur-dependent, subunit alpha [Opitutales bacterium]|nr:L-serine ammonia-lyase, iron-sulfur-dependent, subunit alpha [Opitutales bacterium]
MEDFQKYNYETSAELLALCEREFLTVSELALRREQLISGKTANEIFERMRTYYKTMRESIRNGLKISSPSPSGLSGGDAQKLLNYADGGNALLGVDLTRLMAYAYAVLETNAQFGRIVATPTAGSAGIVPACLVLLEESRGIDETRLTQALFTASGIGVLIASKAFVAGAQGGCQAEVGSASALAAAAVTELLGGSAAQVCNAATFALINSLGLVCDPIGGFVEIPCVSRNGMFAVHAYLAANLALAGISPRVDLDDAIFAMRDVGRRMPVELRETSRGGLAISPGACRLCKRD